MQSITPVRRILEILAVIVTAFGKFLFMDYLNWRLPFVVIATISWVVYILYRIRTVKGVNQYWGFRTDNFIKAFRIVLPLGVVSIVAFIVIGFIKGTINITWHIIPILILYPIWGAIQQFLLIALTVGNMKDIPGISLHKGFIILLSALLFGSIHYPFVWLMVVTFFLSIFYGWVYLRQKNLYVLGLFHGWLGAVFYYTVLDRDPFLEMFGKLLN